MTAHRRDDGCHGGDRKCTEWMLPGLRGSYIAGNGLVACRAIRWSWGSVAPKEWCIPLRVAKEGGRGGTMGSSGATDGDGVYGTARATFDGGSICNGCNGFGWMLVVVWCWSVLQDVNQIQAYIWWWVGNLGSQQ